jgi:hypothetical protein
VTGQAYPQPYHPDCGILAEPKKRAKGMAA